MFVGRYGLRRGRAHALSEKNCQDALAFEQGFLDNMPYAIGIIADGCSEGKSSEVGANLATAYALSQSYYMLARGVAPSVIPALLYGDMLGMLKDLTGRYNFRHPTQRAQFIQDNLLFTTIGFIATATETVIFVNGDGVVVINGEVIEKRQNNTPTYIAYHLVERRYLDQSVSELPQSFEMIHLSTTQLKRIAIGSDAWLDERKLLNEVWQFTQLPPRLQRQMNIWSNQKYFQDDASIVTLEIDTSGGA